MDHKQAPHLTMPTTALQIATHYTKSTVNCNNTYNNSKLLMKKKIVDLFWSTHELQALSHLWRSNISMHLWYFLHISKFSFLWELNI